MMVSMAVTPMDDWHQHSADEYVAAFDESLAEADLGRARLSLALLTYHYPKDERVALGVLQLIDAER